jgi:hypothetical protein
MTDLEKKVKVIIHRYDGLGTDGTPQYQVVPLEIVNHQLRYGVPYYTDMEGFVPTNKTVRGGYLVYEKTNGGKKW